MAYGTNERVKANGCLVRFVVSDLVGGTSYDVLVFFYSCVSYS